MRSQGFGCSPIKKSRELGLDRSDTRALYMYFASVFEQSKSRHNDTIELFVHEIKNRTNQSRRSCVGIRMNKLTNIGETRLT